MADQVVAWDRALQITPLMVGLLLFLAILVVGGLGLVALGLELAKQGRARRAVRARAALRHAQVVESRRLAHEHARLLARPPTPPPVEEPKTSLTSLFQLLSAELEPPAPPVRAAKGTGPPPIPAAARAQPPRPLPPPRSLPPPRPLPPPLPRVPRIAR
jgi:hypothetical protein